MYSSYIPPPPDGITDAFRRGIPTSRRSSGLTIWMTLRAHGWNVIREAVQRNVDLTRSLEDQLRESGFNVLPDGVLSIACARWEPAGHSEQDLNDLQRKISNAVIESGRSWFSTANHDGKVWLRMNLVNIHTQQHHIDEFVQLLNEVVTNP